MNELKFWQLVYLFIQKYDYQIAYYNEIYKDVWLKNSEHRLIRLMYKEQLSEMDSKNFARYSIKGKEKLKENFGLDILKIKTYIIDPKSEIAPFYKKYIDDEDITIEQFIIKDMEDLSLTELSQNEIEIFANSKTSAHYRNKLFQKKKVTKSTNKNKLVNLSVIIGSILLGFLLTFALGRYTNEFTYEKVGALYPKHFWEGHVYQIITSIFANNHLTEILLQIIILLMTTFLLKYINKPNHIYYYFVLSGILANASNLIFESSIISMGAHGAVAGLLGALTYLIITKQAIYHKDSMLIIGISTAFVLISTLLHLNHNLQVHFIGYFVGILLAYISRWKFTFPLLSSAIVISLLSIFIVYKSGLISPVTAPPVNTEQKVQSGDVSILELEQSIKKGAATDQTYLEYGLYKLIHENYEDAQKYWLKGLTINPNNAELNYQVAIVYRAQNNLTEALKYAQQAEKSQPSEQYQVLINELNARIANTEETNKE